MHLLALDNPLSVDLWRLTSHGVLLMIFAAKSSFLDEGMGAILICWNKDTYLKCS